jgi:hypothetical protein
MRLWCPIGLTLVLFAPIALFAQRERGELRLEVHDSQGVSVSGNAKLVSELNQVQKELKIGPDGRSFGSSGGPFDHTWDRSAKHTGSSFRFSDTR